MKYLLGRCDPPEHVAAQESGRKFPIRNQRAHGALVSWGAAFLLLSSLVLASSVEAKGRQSNSKSQTRIRLASGYSFDLPLPHDLMISAGGGGIWEGANIRSDNGIDSSARQATLLGESVAYEVRLLRACVMTETEMGTTYKDLTSFITGNAGGVGWTIQYFDMQSDPPLEITNDVTSVGGWALPDLPDSEERPVANLRIVVTRDASVTTGVSPTQNALLQVTPSFDILDNSNDDGDSVLAVTSVYQRAPATAPPVSRDLWVKFYPRSGFGERMVGGFFQGSKDGRTWDNLNKISVTPPEGVYSELLLGPISYRYLRYFSPKNSYGNVAQVEFFFGTNPLSGETFGAPDSQPNLNTTFDKAFDNNVNTYFDAPGPDGAYTGIDTEPNGPIAATWSTGPGGISAQGIFHPSHKSGREIVGNTVGRLTAYTAVDWDLWKRDVLGTIRESWISDVCTYTWSATVNGVDAGTFPQGKMGPNVLWKAPTVTATTIVTITLKVTDQGGVNKGRADLGARAAFQGVGDPPRQFTEQIWVIKP